MPHYQVGQKRETVQVQGQLTPNQRACNWLLGPRLVNWRKLVNQPKKCDWPNCDLELELKKKGSRYRNMWRDQREWNKSEVIKVYCEVCVCVRFTFLFFFLESTNSRMLIVFMKIDQLAKARKDHGRSHARPSTGRLEVDHSPKSAFPSCSPDG